MMNTKKLKAIDLYSGVGGWSLGLRLAGIEVVSSYELWGPANETNFKNNAHQAQTVDIRRLSLEDLPKDIDIVVGSPPCTQFSFSNRGGGGDLVDGLQDIVQFLRIVDRVKPRLWAMENVPRVAKIIETELRPGGALEEFSHLHCRTDVVDMSEYGLPQRRHRCIAGNFDTGLLRSYRIGAPSRTLGEVIAALSNDPIADPLFGLEIPRNEVTDHVEEDLFSLEEVRINRANKMTHTVYNAMPFPDPLDRSVRTITATCTRVSRESIVIATSNRGDAYRRLTLRERACLQGFPITFQFYGASHGQKLRMIGNAVPPAFSYLMGHVLQGHRADEIIPLHQAGRELRRPEPLPTETPPDRVGRLYPPHRRFRFAIPSLQLKSGVRFELTNDCLTEMVKWRIAFYFGTSKAIQTIKLDDVLLSFLTSRLSPSLGKTIETVLAELKQILTTADIPNMQAVWTHKGPGRTRPFMMLDDLDHIGSSLSEAIKSHKDEACLLVDATLANTFGAKAETVSGSSKIVRNAPIILAGLLIGSISNSMFEDRSHNRSKTKLVG